MTMLIVLIVGIVVFAIGFDLIARARGRYRSAAEWEQIRRRRKSRGRTFRADPEDPRRR